MEDLFSTCTIKAHLMYELVILTTEFGEFEFSRTFSLLLLPDKKWGKIQIETPKFSKSVGMSNSQNVKKCEKFKFKLPKSQKVQENSNSPNPAASITI